MSCFEPRGDLNLNVSTSFLITLPLTFDTHTVEIREQAKGDEIVRYIPHTAALLITLRTS
jgi:hypothetical protein